MNFMNTILGRRKTRSQKSNTTSASSSRRHSVSELPQAMEEDLAAPRGDQLLLGGGSSSTRFADQAMPLPRRTTRSSAPPPYMAKKCEYGFTIMSKEEEDKLDNLKKRVMPNFEFDDDSLWKLGIHHDIDILLENLGWKQFADGVSVDMRVDLALEMFVTMEKIMKEIEGEEVECLKFRIKDKEYFISYSGIEQVLGFIRGAPELVDIQEGELDEFWEKIGVDANRVRKSISNITLRIFHSWMSKRILGRMREHKVTDRELNWLYSGLVKKQRINPTYIMIDRWTCEAISGTGDVGSGCYLTQIAHVVTGGLRGIPRFYLKGVAMDIEHLKRGHYIGGNEKKGYTVAETEITLPDPRLKLFTPGRTHWKDEHISKKWKKNKRGNIVGGSTSQQANEEQTNFPPHTETCRSAFQHEPSGQGDPQGWGSSTGAHQGQAWGYGMYPPPPPPSNYGYPPPHQGVFINLSFGSAFHHLPQPEQGMRIMGAYATRNEQNINAIRSHTSHLENGTAGMIYEMGRLGITRPDQYEGAYHNFFEQGYNARDEDEE